MGILSKYKYYEHPEGTDPLGKTFGAMKQALRMSLCVGLIDVWNNPNIKTFPHILNRLAFWVLPACGMAFAATSVIFLATNVRQRDDALNYALGGLAASGVVHQWIRNVKLTGICVPLFMGLAVMWKTTRYYRSTDMIISPSLTDKPEVPFTCKRNFAQFALAFTKETRPWKLQENGQQ